MHKEDLKTHRLSASLKLLLFLLLVNLIPSIGLLFTEPYNLPGKIVLILLPLGLYSILFSLFRNPAFAQLCLIPLLVLHAFQIVVFYLFGEGVIAVDMFLNVLTTSVSEAGEVLDAVWASVVFVLVVYLPTIVVSYLAYRRKIRLTPQTRKKTLIIGILLVGSSLLISKGAKELNTGHFVFTEEVYPVNVVSNLKIAGRKWIDQRNYLKESATFTYEALLNDTTSTRKVYVLVIGETSRADNWGLYGYERNTTPLLAKDTSLVVFDDVITQSNTTHKSVSIMLTASSAEDYDEVYHQKSIVTAFKEAGFTTVFLSNQSPNHSFVDYYAREADYSRYYRFFNERTNHYDEDMLPELQEYIYSTSDNLFIVLHTYGSHFNYSERYPAADAIFKPDQVTKIRKEEREKMVNAYDNTIVATDRFLHQVFSILEESKACSFVLYASDHGEDLLDDKRNRFLHASPTPTYYQLRIPMLLWFTSAYKDFFPETYALAMSNQATPVTTNVIFHTLLDAAHIDSPYLREERSLVNKELLQTERMYLTDHDRPLPFYQVGLKKEDREMIKKKNIAH